MRDRWTLFRFAVLAAGLLLVAVVSAAQAPDAAANPPDAPQPQFSAAQANVGGPGSVQPGDAGNPRSAEGGIPPADSEQHNIAAGADGASLHGTVTDLNGADLLPGATVVLEGQGVRLTSVSDGSGEFSFANLKPLVPYRVTISAPGFDDWTSPPITLTPGEYGFIKDIQLKLSNAVTSVTVTASTEQIATEQVAIAEQQRVFGIIPNFYVVYDSQNAVPLTAKLKLKLALKVSVDPVTLLGAAFLGAVNQAADTPDYQQGWKGYGQRAGAVYTDGFTDLMFGGAILPIVLHQDPRYFYQGTGTTRSRMFHAIKSPFICKGDNGKWQPNYSTIGGDLISAAISNAYYPKSNRGASLVFDNLLINSAAREASTMIQEFLLRKLTPSAKEKDTN